MREGAWLTGLDELEAKSSNVVLLCLLIDFCREREEWHISWYAHGRKRINAGGECRMVSLYLKVWGLISQGTVLNRCYCSEDRNKRFFGRKYTFLSLTCGGRYCNVPIC